MTTSACAIAVPGIHTTPTHTHVTPHITASGTFPPRLQRHNNTAEWERNPLPWLDRPPCHCLPRCFFPLPISSATRGSSPVLPLIAITLSLAKCSIPNVHLPPTSSHFLFFRALHRHVDGSEQLRHSETLAPAHLLLVVPANPFAQVNTFLALTHPHLAASLAVTSSLVPPSWLVWCLLSRVSSTLCPQYRRPLAVLILASLGTIPRNETNLCPTHV